jgi:histidinol-phosphate aminotransferase
MKSGIQRFETLPPYTPIEPFEVLSARLGRRPEEIVKLDANENPYGMSSKARQALQNLNYPHIYPDPESRALRAALQQFTGVAEKNLLAGSGADELIDLLLRVVLEPQDKVVICPPTFGMYSFDTEINSGRVIEVRRKPGYGLDVAAIRTAVENEKPRVLFITSPNNPDGGIPTTQELDALIDLPVLVVIDEAYIEFCAAGGRLGESLSRIRLAPERENLVVLRTFSKWAGLAGLRVGYGAFPDWIMPTLWKVKQPYNVNVAATAAALASLDDLNYLAANVQRLRVERERLMAGLRTIPYLEPVPSQANFILCQVKGRNALELKKNLAGQGVFVRHYATELLSNFIRISVGRESDTDFALRALRSLE